MVLVHFFSVLKLRGLSSTSQSDGVWSRKGQRHSLAGLPNPGFSLRSWQVSVQRVSGSASSEEEVHEPGDLSQASENFQGRIGSSHAVPVVSHSHRRCAVKFGFFFNS